MKKSSKEGENQKRKNEMMLEEKNPKLIDSKLNIKIQKEKQELSPIALMKHRIEEMNKILFEKRNQRKGTE